LDIAASKCASWRSQSVSPSRPPREKTKETTLPRPRTTVRRPSSTPAKIPSCQLTQCDEMGAGSVVEPRRVAWREVGLRGSYVGRAVPSVDRFISPSRSRPCEMGTTAGLPCCRDCIQGSAQA
jgi:hypothetical protein